MFTNNYLIDKSLDESTSYDFKIEAINQAGLHSNSNCILESVILSDLNCINY